MTPALLLLFAWIPVTDQPYIDPLPPLVCAELEFNDIYSYTYKWNAEKWTWEREINKTYSQAIVWNWTPYGLHVDAWAPARYIIYVKQDGPYKVYRVDHLGVSRYIHAKTVKYSASWMGDDPETNDVDYWPKELRQGLDSYALKEFIINKKWPSPTVLPYGIKFERVDKNEQ